MSVERWAQRIIEKELNCRVVVHNGSQPSMYDLRIGAVEAADVATECVGAMFPNPFIELGSAGFGPS